MFLNACNLHAAVRYAPADLPRAGKRRVLADEICDRAERSPRDISGCHSDAIVRSSGPSAARKTSWTIARRGAMIFLLVRTPLVPHFLRHFSRRVCTTASSPHLMYYVVRRLPVLWVLPRGHSHGGGAMLG